MARDLNDFSELVAGVNRDWLCEFLGIHKKTLERWISGEINAPQAVRLLLRIKLEGDLSALGGDSWQGFSIGTRYDDRKLYAPLFRGGFDPEQITAMFFLCQDAWQDKRDFKHTLAQVNELRAELEKERQRAVYYKEKLREIELQRLPDFR